MPCVHPRLVAVSWRAVGHSSGRQVCRRKGSAAVRRVNFGPAAGCSGRVVPDHPAARLVENWLGAILLGPVDGRFAVVEANEAAELAEMGCSQFGKERRGTRGPALLRGSRVGGCTTGFIKVGQQPVQDSRDLYLH